MGTNLCMSYSSRLTVDMRHGSTNTTPGGALELILTSKTWSGLLVKESCAALQQNRPPKEKGTCHAKTTSKQP